MSNQAEKPKERYLFKIRSWYFAPKIKLTILALLLISILVYLGTWQLGRAQYKEKIYKTLQAKATAQPVDISTLKTPTLEKDRFTPIKVEGIYLNNYTILIDNQMYEHKPGYRVITPMHLPRLPNWILVDRGWVPLGKDRKELPKVDVVFGLKEVHGIINSIGCGIELEKQKLDQQIKWPIVLQRLDFQLIENQLHHPIYNFVLQLNEKQPGSYAHSKPDFGISADKHLGYALEWYLLALLVLMYFIIVSTKRR